MRNRVLNMANDAVFQSKAEELKLYDNYQIDDSTMYVLQKIQSAN